MEVLTFSHAPAALIWSVVLTGIISRVNSCSARSPFPPHPHQASHLWQLTLPTDEIAFERLQDLQSLTAGRDGNLGLRDGHRQCCRRKRQVARREAGRREAVACGWGEAEGAGRGGDGVRGGVEV